MSDILFDLFNSSRQGIYGDLEKIRQWSDQLYSSPRASLSPARDFFYSYTTNTASLDLPGYSREEIEIEITSDTSILIKANNESRGLTKYKLNIPIEVSISDTKVSFKDGVLSFSFTKKEKESRTLQITD